MTRVRPRRALPVGESRVSTAKPGGLLLRVGQERQHRGLEALAGRALGDALGHARHQVVHLPVHDGRVQPLLRAEVLVDDGLGDARLLGDLLDRGRLVALRGEDPPADLHQLDPAFGPGEPLFLPILTSNLPAVTYRTVTYSTEPTGR